MNSTIQELFDRKSVRVFTGEKISDENKALILEAAAQAPTAGNQQLYTIIDVTDQRLKESLAETCDHQPMIAKADMVLVFCADCKKWYDGYIDAGCTPRSPGVGDLLLAVSDANIAAQNAVTAAWSLGIGSCYIGDIMENYEQMRELLQLPQFVFPAAMVIFGVPTEQQLLREKPLRAPIECIVSENGYPEMNESYRAEMFAGKSAEGLAAFCERKYESDFAREMTRSVGKYLEDYTKFSDGQIQFYKGEC